MEDIFNIKVIEKVRQELNPHRLPGWGVREGGNNPRKDRRLNNEKYFYTPIDMTSPKGEEKKDLKKMWVIVSPAGGGGHPLG